MNEALLRELVVRSRPDLLRNQCLVVSLVLNRLFGGEILVGATPAGESHYVNSLLGEVFDVLRDHLSIVDYQFLDDPEALCRVPHVNRQVRLFEERLRNELTRRLPILETQHVIFQNVDDNPGSYARPEFSSVLLLGSREHRLDAELFAPGQTMWLKFVKGPIVARGTLVRCVGGLRRDWSDADIRSVCRRTALSTHAPTWERLSHSSATRFMLIEVDDAEALDVPIYPRDRGYGASILPLSTLARQIAWLDGDIAPVDLPLDESPPLRYTPFYRFRWEDELDAEVTTAIDQRMPKSGRFFDRVRIVNQALREYFAMIDAAGEDLGLTDDEVTLLSEVLEESGATARLTRRELLECLAANARSASDEQSDAAGALLYVAESVASLSSPEYARLMDAVYSRIPFLHRVGSGAFTLLKPRHVSLPYLCEERDADDH